VVVLRVVGLAGRYPGEDRPEPRSCAPKRRAKSRQRRRGLRRVANTPAVSRARCAG